MVDTTKKVLKSITAYLLSKTQKTHQYYTVISRNIRVTSTVESHLLQYCRTKPVQSNMLRYVHCKDGPSTTRVVKYHRVMATLEEDTEERDESTKQSERPHLKWE